MPAHFSPVPTAFVRPAFSCFIAEPKNKAVREGSYRGCFERRKCRAMVESWWRREGV